MYLIKLVIKANICCFYDTVYTCASLDEKDFFNNINYFLLEENADYYIETSEIGYEYDLEEMNNIYKDVKFKKEQLEFTEIIEKSQNAFKQTIETDKTIDLQGFVDNLIKELQK